MIQYVGCTMKLVGALSKVGGGVSSQSNDGSSIGRH